MAVLGSPFLISESTSSHWSIRLFGKACPIRKKAKARKRMGARRGIIFFILRMDLWRIY
jgi:hypothetical protein